MRALLLVMVLALAVGGAGRTVQAGALSRLQVHEAPLPAPELSFRNREGDTIALSDFRGRTVLLNIWATWCLPCREEMPALDRLQARLGGASFQVVALSIDRNGAEAVRRFYDEIGITRLEIFTGSAGRILHDLAIVGLPVTLLVNAEGREIARAIGPVAWDEPEIVEFIEARLGTPLAQSPVD